MSSVALNSTTASTTSSSSTTFLDTTTSSTTPSSSSTTTSTTSTTSTSSTSTSFTSTSTVTSSSSPPTTVFVPSTVTVPPSQSTSVLVISSTETPPSQTTTSSAPSQTTTSPAVLNDGGNNNGSGGGLSTAGVTAIAVVVPVVVVALLVVAGIFFWRRRKQKKNEEELRRKEVEEYGFNPNNDPTLPAVASDSGHDMTEDHSSGYRGWGVAAASNRKMSTTLSGGHTQGQLSDAGSQPYGSGGSPNGGFSDGNSGDGMLHPKRGTMTSDEIGELGRAPVAGAALNQPGMKRGPSNASSTYSAGNVSDLSEGAMHPGGGFDAYQPHNGYGYSQHGPYGDGTYASDQAGGMPVVRDVSARRNTRIQQPGNYQQGNSGISQNF